MLENVPILWSCTLIAGIKFPAMSAALLGVYTLTRIPYTLGYKTGNPAKVSPRPLLVRTSDDWWQRNALGPWGFGVAVVATAAEFCE